MSEYTKSPWFVTPDGYIRQSEGERRLFIASAVEIPNKDGGDKATKANLNLMAASPELLEALTAIMDWYRMDSTERAAITYARFDAADAAIAKAAGK